MSQEIYRTLALLIEEELGTGPISLAPETVLADLRGWDSVAVVGVLVGIERRFGIVVDRDQMEALHQAKDLADLIGGAPDHSSLR